MGIAKPGKAAGNSTNTINYNTTDLVNDITGDIYYRLEEVDLDGNATYSGIQEVNVVNKQQLQIFPSPAQNILYVQTTSSGDKISALFNVAGQNMLPGLRVDPIGNNFYSIDISSLPKGIYIVKTTSAAVEVSKN